MNARGSSASVCSVEMHNATRKRLFESLQSPLESFGRLRTHGWNNAATSFPALPCFWIFYSDAGRFCPSSNRFHSTEAVILEQNQRKCCRSSSQSLNLQVTVLDGSRRTMENLRHGQSVPVSVVSWRKSLWKSEPILSYSDYRFPSNGALLQYAQSVNTSASILSDSPSNGDSEDTISGHYTEEITVCKKDGDSGLNLPPPTADTIEKPNSDTTGEPGPSGEVIDSRDVTEKSESSFALASDTCSGQTQDHGLTSEEDSASDEESLMLQSSWTECSSPVYTRLPEEGAVGDDMGCLSTLEILTPTASNDLDAECSSSTHSGSNAIGKKDFVCCDLEDGESEFLTDRTTSLHNPESVKSGEENSSTEVVNGERPGGSCARKKKKKKSFKIVHEDIKSNTLGPFGDLPLPPEQLRVDTRDSILKDQALQDSQQESSSEVRTPVAEGEPSMSKPDVSATEVAEVVNGSPPPVLDRKHEPVLLLMIGCQGSGKTKFSLDLVLYGAITWARINQDTLRGPSTKGLREECVTKARQLLELGYCIVVDRMNFSDEQRAGFMDLARELGLSVHAVVFKLPFVDNVHNVAVRLDHEGGFQGKTKSHKEIIRRTRNRLFYRKGLPKQRDAGFDTIVCCESNDHYAAAFRQWVNYGRPMSGGQILTTDLWRKMLHEKSRVLFARARTQLPRPLQQTTPEMKQTAVGYVPGRDGPLLEESSEEEAEESDD